MDRDRTTGETKPATDSQAASDLIEEDRQEPMPAERPSQAEGDRETIDEDIREKEQDGDL